MCCSTRKIETLPLDGNADAVLRESRRLIIVSVQSNALLHSGHETHLRS
jgi:hypothetical protein